MIWQMNDQNLREIMRYDYPPEIEVKQTRIKNHPFRGFSTKHKANAINTELSFQNILIHILYVYKICSCGEIFHPRNYDSLYESMTSY